MSSAGLEPSKRSRSIIESHQPSLPAAVIDAGFFVPMNACSPWRALPSDRLRTRVVALPGRMRKCLGLKDYHAFYWNQKTGSLDGSWKLLLM